MSKITLNQATPDFELPATNGQQIKLSDLKGKNVVLYFYPRDNTPGCTIESKNFRDSHRKFEALNTIILGVSRDSIKKHENFKNKHAFPFELLSDEQETLCNTFDVIKQKNLFGKTVKGIQRSTFLIDSQGILRKEWRKVKISGHVEEVLEAVAKL